MVPFEGECIVNIGSVLEKEKSPCSLQKRFIETETNVLRLDFYKNISPFLISDRIFHL
jgi:hypothetical protein